MSYCNHLDTCRIVRLTTFKFFITVVLFSVQSIEHWLVYNVNRCARIQKLINKAHAVGENLLGSVKLRSDLPSVKSII